MFYDSLTRNSFLDTVEVLSGYVDVVVMRHPEPGAVQVALVIISIIYPNDMS